MNKSSGISVSNAGCVGAQSTDPSSRTTTELITSETSGKSPDSSLNGLGNVRHFIHTSKSQSSERLESTTSEKCVSEDKKEELSISRTELGDTNIDEELLLALDDDEDCISIIMDPEEDILLQTDDIMNYTFSLIYNGSVQVRYGNHRSIFRCRIFGHV